MTEVARDLGGGGLLVDFFAFGVSSVGAYVGLGTSSTGESTEELRSIAWYGGGGGDEVEAGGGSGSASFWLGGGAGLGAGSGGEGSDRSSIEFRATKSLFASCSALTAACDCS